MHDKRKVVEDSVWLRPLNFRFACLMLAVASVVIGRTSAARGRAVSGGFRVTGWMLLPLHTLMLPLMASSSSMLCSN